MKKCCFAYGCLQENKKISLTVCRYTGKFIDMTVFITGLIASLGWELQGLNVSFSNQIVYHSNTNSLFHHHQDDGVE